MPNRVLPIAYPLIQFAEPLVDPGFVDQIPPARLQAAGVRGSWFGDVMMRREESFVEKDCGITHLSQIKSVCEVERRACTARINRHCVGGMEVAGSIQGDRVTCSSVSHR